MLTWTQLRHPSAGLIRSLTALNRGQIEKLRLTFKPALKTPQSSSVVVAPDKRQPKTGATRTPRLNSEDLLILHSSLLCCLSYSAPSGTVVGRIAKLGLKWVHGLKPVLETALAEVKQLPVRAGTGEKPIGSINQLLKRCPQLSFIIDGVERNVRRPKDSAKPKQGSKTRRQWPKEAP